MTRTTASIIIITMVIIMAVEMEKSNMTTTMMMSKGDSADDVVVDDAGVAKQTMKHNPKSSHDPTTDSSAATMPCIKLISWFVLWFRASTQRAKGALLTTFHSTVLFGVGSNRDNIVQRAMSRRQTGCHKRPKPPHKGLAWKTTCGVKQNQELRVHKA